MSTSTSASISTSMSVSMSMSMSISARSHLEPVPRVRDGRLNGRRELPEVLAAAAALPRRARDEIVPLLVDPLVPGLATRGDVKLQPTRLADGRQRPLPNHHHRRPHLQAVPAPVPAPMPMPMPVANQGGTRHTENYKVRATSYELQDYKFVAIAGRASPSAPAGCASTGSTCASLISTYLLVNSSISR